MNHCVVVGRGINYGNAFEFSLKLMETCYVIAERFSAADFVHGPIALIEHDFPAFVFMPPGKTFSAHARPVRAAAQAARRSDRHHWSQRRDIPCATEAIRVPGEMPEIFTPIPYIIPGQIFAALLAEVKGLDPDKPRSLNIVTQTV